MGEQRIHNYQPSHAVAFRTIDRALCRTKQLRREQTRRIQFLGHLRRHPGPHQGDKQIKGINNSNANNQYEFYNYSPSWGNANPQEIANQFSNSGNVSSLALPHYTDFFNTGNNNGISIQDELYKLNNQGSNSNNIQQVNAASNTAFNNYILYLGCAESMTGNNGQPVGSNNCTSPSCPPSYSS